MLIIGCFYYLLKRGGLDKYNFLAFSFFNSKGWNSIFTIYKDMDCRQIFSVLLKCSIFGLMTICTPNAVFALESDNLNLKAQSTPVPFAIYHKITWGEDLDIIALNHHLGRADLLKWNEI